MKRMGHFVFAAVIGVLTAAGLIAGGIYYYQRPNVIHVAVPRDSEDQAILAAASLEFSKNKESLRLKPVLVENLAESARALEEGRADLAVVRNDIAMPPSGQTLLILRHNAALLFAPAQSSISGIEDLAGRRIGILQSGQRSRADNQLLLDAALSQYEISPDEVRRRPITLSELPRTIEQGEIDALFAVGVPGTGWLKEAVSAVAAAGKGPPVFEGIEIVRGAFGGSQPRPASDFDTLGVSTRLVAKSSLSNDLAGAVTKLLLAARPAIAAKIPVANRIEAPPADKGAALPVHPGALAFLDDDEQSFFERYGDAFYIGAMCLSLLGTALAAAAARLTRQPAIEADRIVRRLIELACVARKTEHAAALDAYEEEADQLLGLALAPSVVHGMSANRMGALDLALNQLRHVIAERRRTLAALARPQFVPRIVRE